ncbi:transporter [Rhodoferax koreense]|uniref:Transporter n=1 Tax=Rhodoferax koreensis TaxID=1842727 RepID=A0A1P8K211_9BURK|nr:BON domain-containing protein [Rhodoferax koreense]APW40035.1 transporter [Rhodoferax koreense]
MKKTTIRLTLTVLAAAALAGGLSGCFPVVVGGAAVGGAMVATDRRTSGTQLEDEGIELRANNRISENFGDRAHVNVTSYNRQVLLTGEVPTAEQQQRIAELVSKVENVRSVVNELAVLGTSTLVQRSNDSYITGKVKATLVDAKDVQANTVKVVTERGTVYLMGRVTQREATRISDLARSVSGVQKVVRVFEILSDQEVQSISTKPPAP